MSTIRTSPEQAVIEGLLARLRGAGIWENRVYRGIIPANAETPFVFFNFQSGGATNFTRRPDADFQVQVRCTAEAIQEAMQGKAQLIALLDDKGEQESPADFVSGGTDWKITTITKTTSLVLTELRDNNLPREHAGDIYEFVLEARAWQL